MDLSSPYFFYNLYGIFIGFSKFLFEMSHNPALVPFFFIAEYKTSTASVVQMRTFFVII